MTRAEMDGGVRGTTTEEGRRTVELRRQGHPVAPRTTVPGIVRTTRPDLVDREFTATAPNQLCVAGIERHEALSSRAVVRGHPGRSVAAGR